MPPRDGLDTEVPLQTSVLFVCFFFLAQTKMSWHTLPIVWHSRQPLGIKAQSRPVLPPPPPCASTAGVPKPQAKQRFNAQSVLRQGRAYARGRGGTMIPQMTVVADLTRRGALLGLNPALCRGLPGAAADLGFQSVPKALVLVLRLQLDVLHVLPEVCEIALAAVVARGAGHTVLQDGVHVRFPWGHGAVAARGAGSTGARVGSLAPAFWW